MIKKHPKGCFFYILLIFLLPALEADNAQSRSCHADYDPGEDGEAPAQALGYESDPVG